MMKTAGGLWEGAVKMNLPSYQHLMLPVLEVMARDGGFVDFSSLSGNLSTHLALPAEVQNEMLPSGRQPVFESRLSWAISYLEKINMLEGNGKGAFRITGSGKSCLSGMAGSSDKETFFAGLPQPLQNSRAGTGYETKETGQAPERDISALFEVSYKQLKLELVRRIHEQSPVFFEKLIIDLLVAMGYGSGRHDIARHLGRSGDGGIDGAISQDQLGLDVVYIQAKRFRPGLPVPVAALRDFAGALEAHKANKGVFVTTARFTKPAKDFVGAISRRIVLIDGGRLASLLIRNNIAVKVREIYKIREIDESYFA